MPRLKALVWIARGWHVGTGDRQRGVIEVNGEEKSRLYVKPFGDGAPLTVYPGEVPSRLPGQAFWDSQGFSSKPFRHG